VVRRVAPMLCPYRWGVAFGMLCVLTYTATLLAGPLIVRYAIDNGLTQGDATLRCGVRGKDRTSKEENV
jgi:hypothetical protein